MAITVVDSPEEVARDRVVVRHVPRHRRRRVTALLVCGAMAVVLVGLGGHEAVQAGHGSSTSSGEEANLARGRAADSARLEAAADAYFAEQANLARGRAADSARLEAAADAYFSRR